MVSHHFSIIFNLLPTPFNSIMFRDSSVLLASIKLFLISLSIVLYLVFLGISNLDTELIVLISRIPSNLSYLASISHFVVFRIFYL